MKEDRIRVVTGVFGTTAGKQFRIRLEPRSQKAFITRRMQYSWVYIIEVLADPTVGQPPFWTHYQTSQWFDSSPECFDRAIAWLDETEQGPDGTYITIDDTIMA